MSASDFGGRCAVRDGACVLLATWIALALGCAGSDPQSWGDPFDAASATPLSTLLSDAGTRADGPVVASGRIGEVCRSSGCWFVLQDVTDGRLSEVLVDLKPRAGFTVEPELQGRRALVCGHLVGEVSDLRFEAVGLQLE